jgi:hypothetical protein
MKSYFTKIKPLPGTNYSEIYRNAMALYKHIAGKTKRRPYIRSAYFKKDKIFLDYFWDHIRQKNLRDRVRRLKYYPCALDLLTHSRVAPSSHRNQMKKSELLYRFMGICENDARFYVQVKENKRGEKHFMSVLPAD